MLIGAVACSLVMMQNIIESPRLRTNLPSGAVVFVEKMATNSISLCLSISSVATPDTASNNGFRHLLEHLLVKGPKRDLDDRLESKGLYLTASTQRDSIRIQIDGPSLGLSVAIEAVKDLLQPLAIEQIDIDRELEIMSNEGALRSNVQLLATRSAALGFSEDGVTPFGDLATMKSATPSKLEELRKSLFIGPNVILSIAGDIEIRSTTESARMALSVLTPVERTKPKGIIPRIGRFEIEGLEGSVRGATVPGLGDSQTLRVIAAALALCANDPAISFTYNPSVYPGLVMLSRNSGSFADLTDLDEVAVQEMKDRGALLVESWIRGQMSSPKFMSRFRALLLADRSEVDIAALIDSIRGMTRAQFREALSAFSAGKCLEVVGK